MGKRSDDFSETTRRNLAKRVDNKCSNPDCRAGTSGPHSNPEKATSIGVAAHITAAQPGGPRYDPTLTSAERKHIENAIWLCQTCSTKIDKDEQKYLPELLRHWKRNAEHEADKNIGQPATQFRTDRDLSQHLLDFYDFQKNPIAMSISKAIERKKAALEALDPNIQVDISYQDNREQYRLTAKQPVTVPFTIHLAKQEKVDSLRQQYRDALEQGKKFSVETSGVNADGSPLFRHFFPGKFMNQEKGVFSFSPHSVTGNLVISPPSNSTKPTDVLYVNGAFYAGSKFVRFEGSVVNSPLHVEMFIPISHSLDQKEGSIRPMFHCDKWIGKEVTRLPYFNQIFQLLTDIAKQQKISFLGEVEGDRLFTAHYRAGKEECRFYDNLIELCDLLEKAREISRYMGIPLIVPERITEKDTINICQLSKLLEEGEVKVKGLGKSLSATLIPNPNFLKNNNTKPNKKNTLRFEESNSQFMIFGTKIPFGTLNHKFSSVKLKTNLKNIDFFDPDIQKNGIQVEWAILKDNEYIISKN